MRTRIRIPAILALSLALAIPALAQTTHDNHAAPAGAPQAAPTVDPEKVDLLHLEFMAKTAELRGKLLAKQAELETLLVAKPGDEAAVKKLVAEISTLRGALLEQTTLFRIRFAKETGMPIRLTRGLGRIGGHGGMAAAPGGDMCGKGKDMMGKGMMMGGKAMPGMPAGGAKADAPAAPEAE